MGYLGRGEVDCPGDQWATRGSEEGVQTVLQGMARETVILLREKVQAHPDSEERKSLQEGCMY